MYCRLPLFHVSLDGKRGVLTSSPEPLLVGGLLVRALKPLVRAPGQQRCMISPSFSYPPAKRGSWLGHALWILEFVCFFVCPHPHTGS